MHDLDLRFSHRARHRLACLFGMFCVVSTASPTTAQVLAPNVVEFLPRADANGSTSAAAPGTVYVSDLASTAESNGWGPVERDRSNGEAAGGDGGVLTINGVTFAKGLGVHAASSVTVSVPSGCTTFQATAGVDDEVGANGSLVFQVLGDTAILFDSGVLTGSSPARDISVDVRGRGAVRLVVSDGGNGIAYDHGDWAAARFVCASTPPAVSGYQLSFYQVNAVDPFVTLDLGKPSPQSDGMIRVDYSAAVKQWPAPDVESFVRVVAVGDGGRSVSNPSNTFVYPCNFSLGSGSQAFSATGGSGSVAVTGASYCGWSAETTAAWVTFASGTSGSGTGSLAYTVAGNSGTTSRTATITVAGLSYTVTQAAAATGGANTAPRVNITRPTAGTQLKNRATRIDMDASDADGSVAAVTVYANGVLIGQSTVAPYSVRWSPSARGTYTLTAIATDNLGARTTSVPVSVTIR
jgi:hypothetical protein